MSPNPLHSTPFSVGSWSSPKPKSSCCCLYQICSDAHGFEKRGKGRRKEGEVKGKDKKNQYHDGAFCDSVCSTYLKLLHIEILCNVLSALATDKEAKQASSSPGIWGTRFLNFHSSFSFFNCETLQELVNSSILNCWQKVQARHCALHIAHSAGQGSLVALGDSPAWGAAIMT